MVRVAVAAMLLAVLGLPLGSSAFAADRRGLTSQASTPASASDSASSTSIANATSANASSTKESSTKESWATASASLTADALVAVALPDPPSTSDAAPAAGVVTELKTVEPSPAGTLSIPSAPAAPSFGSDFLTSNSLASIHALLAPPAAFVKLKQPPRSHSFFDSRNTLGFATLGASLTADALSTQKGLAYPGFVEMNPIARPFVQSRTGAAVYNAGSFGLMAGLMYWAHKTEHHKLERILPFAIGSWEGLLSARNYHVIANRTR